MRIWELWFEIEFSKKILTNKDSSIYSPSHSYGGMAEWFNATVLKTVVPQGTQSSNLCPSAMKNRKSSHIENFFVISNLLKYQILYFHHRDPLPVLPQLFHRILFYRYTYLEVH